MKTLDVVVDWARSDLARHKMLCLTCLILALVPGVSLAGEDFNFAFARVKMPEIGRLVFGEVEKKSYVFDPEFQADERLVGFDLRGVTRRQVLTAYMDLLERNGYTVVVSRGIYSVRKNAKVNDDDLEVFVYQPKYRSVSYVRGVVSRIFPKLFAGGGAAPGGQLSLGTAGSGQAVPQGLQMQPGQGGAVGQQGVVGSSLQVAPQAPVVAASSAVGADADTFAVRGTRRQIDQLEDVLAMVDKEAGQVLIRAHVFEVTSGKQDGSAFSLALNVISKAAPGGGGALSNWVYTLGKDVVQSGNSVTVHNSAVDAVFSALAADSHFKTVSSPSLRAVSGEKARFSVGSDVPILGAIVTNTTGTTQSVDYRSSGVILEVTPQVREGRIDLQVNQELSDFVPTSTGVNNSPTLNKRELSTTLGVQSGDVVILGGLDESKASDESTGLPFLPKFLRTNGSTDSKTELMLVMEVIRL